MRELLSVRFESEAIPADWIETKRLYRFEQGALRTAAAPLRLRVVDQTQAVFD